MDYYFLSGEIFSLNNNLFNIVIKNIFIIFNFCIRVNFIYNVLT